ncbi:hypothetical protein ACFFTN_03660 [Aminobacter aganoensis]|uniref:Uncharacterized protein n=1 Tax=Aminobacter aganoensis TaxID=83264 RepID=A0A7X0KKJ8_9HYPH|nr:MULTISPECIES: hypothetical protein [Aminobacter]KQU64351.1 hypothetical protein ASC75_14550 [Aminobacter sp. DSM 101952]MBB6354087.1 hypothetical protein [Aminobacter aganoensis]
MSDQPKSWHPTFEPRNFPRRAETDAQWACVLRDQREHAEAKGIYLGLFQLLAAHRGFVRTCPLRGCRRLGRCTGRRAEDDWSFPFRPFIPPCVPLDADLVEELRAEIRAETDRMVAGLEARGDG